MDAGESPFQPRGPVAHRLHDKPFLPEIFPEQLAKLRIIVDHQDAILFQCASGDSGSVKDHFIEGQRRHVVKKCEEYGSFRSQTFTQPKGFFTPLYAARPYATLQPE